MRRGGSKSVDQGRGICHTAQHNTAQHRGKSTAQGEKHSTGGDQSTFSIQNISNVSKPHLLQKKGVKTFFAPSFVLVPKMWGAKKHGLLSLAFTLLMSFPDSSNCSGFHWLSASHR